MNTSGDPRKSVLVTAIAVDEFNVEHGITVAEAVASLAQELGLYPDAKYTPVLRGAPVAMDYVLQEDEHLTLMIHSKGGSF